MSPTVFEIKTLYLSHVMQSLAHLITLMYHSLTTVHTILHVLYFQFLENSFLFSFSFFFNLHRCITHCPDWPFQLRPSDSPLILLFPYIQLISFLWFTFARIALISIYCINMIHYFSTYWVWLWDHCVWKFYLHLQESMRLILIIY